jgi:hypothetical protein
MRMGIDQTGCEQAFAGVDELGLLAISLRLMVYEMAEINPFLLS